MKKRALVIGKVWPEPGSSAAGRHMLEIMQSLLASDWQVTFATAATDDRYSFDLHKLSIATAQIAVNDDSFDHWLIELNPQLVIFDRFMTEEQFGWRVARYCPQAGRGLDTEDLHFLREYRQHVADKSFGDVVLEPEVLLDSNLALREIASLYRSDLTLMISQAEMQLLQKLLPIASQQMFYFPFISEGRKTENPDDFAHRRDFVFIGTMMHKPNQQAVRLLKKSLWPKIRQRLPNARLQVIGSYMGTEFLQMHKPSEGFEVLGRVDDLTAVLKKARIHLAPLLFGAGLKGKLLEAMEYGVVSVTTRIGAEGISEVDQWPGRVVDSEAEMIEAAVTLYEDESSWMACQQRGFEILQKQFSAAHLVKLQQRFDDLLLNLPALRQQNFFGRMLQHHFHASTEYMSRWITAKNL